MLAKIIYSYTTRQAFKIVSSVKYETISISEI